MARMDWDDYLRHEAATYRQLAEKPENVFGKQELLDLAAVCEEVANSIRIKATPSVDIVEKVLLRLDRAQWRHTIRIVHRHCRAFQRGRRGATLRKGRSMMG